FKGKVITYGTSPTAYVRTEHVQSQGGTVAESDLVSPCGQAHARLPLVGEHNILNALAAVSVACSRGMSFADAVAALATLKPADKRGQVLQLGNITVVNDCYNSNPKALYAMVDALA